MITNNLEEFKNVCEIIASNIKKGDVISLKGDLGAGKTTMVQNIMNYFNYDKEVTSPTFSLVNIYDGDLLVYHLDLYRLDNPDEILDIDYESYFYPEDEITFIEWAEKAGDFLPEDIIHITIRKDADDLEKRIIISDTERILQC